MAARVDDKTCYYNKKKLNKRPDTNNSAPRQFKFIGA